MPKQATSRDSGSDNWLESRGTVDHLRPDQFLRLHEQTRRKCRDLYNQFKADPSEETKGQLVTMILEFRRGAGDLPFKEAAQFIPDGDEETDVLMHIGNEPIASSAQPPREPLFSGESLSDK